MSKKVMAIVAVIALVAILGVCLVACNAESIEKKLEKAGYTCESYTGKDAQKEAKDDATIEWMVVGTKGLSEGVTVIKFANTDDAKDFEKNAATFSIFGKTVVVKRIAGVVYYGTEQGVKDAQ